MAIRDRNHKSRAISAHSGTEEATLSNFRPLYRLSKIIAEAFRYNRHGQALTKGSCDNTPSKKGSFRRFLETAFEKMLRRVLRRRLAMGLEGGRLLRRGSKNRGQKLNPIQGRANHEVQTVN